MNLVHCALHLARRVSACKILSVEGGVVTVDKIDAFDKTPVLDLKPVITSDAPKGATGPSWLGRREKAKP